MTDERGMRAVALGTGGGPGWRRATDGSVRHGIATAVQVDGAVYLFDAGYGAARQLVRAGYDLPQLRGVFITHMHSDHLVDLPGLMLFGMWQRGLTQDPVALVGPGDRGALPLLSRFADAPPAVLTPDDPTPGITGTFARLVEAYAADLNDRAFDTLRPSPHAFFAPRDIQLPAGCGYDPNDSPYPDMASFEVYADDLVRVTATLVQHPPTAPAFAFRIDSEHGSVVVSGDTAPTPNMQRLSEDADLAFHEAFDFTQLERRYGPENDWSDDVRSVVDHHRKAHSSAADAIALCERAGARSVALNHLAPAHLAQADWLRLVGPAGLPVHVPDDLHAFTIA